MKLSDIVSKVDKKWQPDFLRFVTTGEATPKFLEYLDQTPLCQTAVDEAFSLQGAALESLALALSKPSPTGTDDKAIAEAVCANLVLCVEGATRLKSELLRPALEKAAEIIKAESPLRSTTQLRERRERIKEAAAEIDRLAGSI